MPEFFANFPVHFTQHQGTIKGSVPVPADAACADMPPFLAHAAALGRKRPLSPGDVFLELVGVVRALAVLLRPLVLGVQEEMVETSGRCHHEDDRGP